MRKPQKITKRIKDNKMKTTTEKTKRFIYEIRKTNKLVSISRGPQDSVLLYFSDLIIQDCGDEDYKIFTKTDFMDRERTVVTNEFIPPSVFEAIKTLPVNNRARAASVAIRALKHKTNPVTIIRYLLTRYINDGLPRLSGAYEAPSIEKENDGN